MLGGGGGGGFMCVHLYDVNKLTDFSKISTNPLFYSHPWR